MIRGIAVLILALIIILLVAFYVTEPRHITITPENPNGTTN